MNYSSVVVVDTDCDVSEEEGIVLSSKTNDDTISRHRNSIS
jgi:hypothetical protein